MTEEQPTNKIPLDSVGSSSHASVENEEASLVPQKRRVSIKTAVKLRQVAIIVSVISVVVLFILGVVTLVGAIIDESSSSFAFALDAFLDSLSSIVVLWRFSGNGGNLYSPRRESIACMVLGILFIISAALIFGKSVHGLVMFEVPEDSLYLWWGSMTNAIVCASLVSVKLYLAYKLESKSLLTDAFNTVAGVILALSTIIGQAVYDADNSIWEIDGITSLICSFALLGYGIWIIYESWRTLKKENELE